METPSLADYFNFAWVGRSQYLMWTSRFSAVVTYLPTYISVRAQVFLWWVTFYCPSSFNLYRFRCGVVLVGCINDDFVGGFGCEDTVNFKIRVLKRGGAVGWQNLWISGIKSKAHTEVLTLLNETTVLNGTFMDTRMFARHQRLYSFPFVRWVYLCDCSFVLQILWHASATRSERFKIWKSCISWIALWQFGVLFSRPELL